MFTTANSYAPPLIFGDMGRLVGPFSFDLCHDNSFINVNGTCGFLLSPLPCTPTPLVSSGGNGHHHVFFFFFLFFVLCKNSGNSSIFCSHFLLDARNWRDVSALIFIVVFYSSYPRFLSSFFFLSCLIASHLVFKPFRLHFEIPRR